MCPAEETEKGLYFLSNLDQNIAVIVRTIYCFKSEKKGNETAGEVIKDALRKVLILIMKNVLHVFLMISGKERLEISLLKDLN